MPFLRAYNVLTVTGTTAIRIPMIKRGVVDFAVGADWTPAAGDVKIAINGTAPANVANLPIAVASGNGAFWEFILTAAELTCKQCVVIVADSATKAVEDQSFIVETFGHASAMYVSDLAAANIPQTGDNFARIGVAGVGLTNLGDARIANLDAATSTRTKPADTQAAVTLVTTTTNLTNAPTAGDLTAAMKTSVTTAATAATPIAASVTGNVGGNVTGSVGSVVGAVGSVTGAVGSVTGAVGSVTGAVGSVTGNVGGNLVGTLSVTERAAIADALLNRDMSVGTDSGSTTVRTMRQALRFLRNKWSIGAGTLTVTKEDDATSSWTAAVTQTAGNPVSTIDPAGP